MTNKENHSQKKAYIISSILLLIIATTTILILQQKGRKDEKYEPCTRSFLTKKEAKSCKEAINAGHHYYIDCMPQIIDDKYGIQENIKRKIELCEKAKKAGYPYITY